MLLSSWFPKSSALAAKLPYSHINTVKYGCTDTVDIFPGLCFLGEYTTLHPLKLYCFNSVDVLLLHFR